MLSVKAGLPSRSFGGQDGNNGNQKQSVPHTRNNRGFPPSNPWNRKFASHTWFDIFPDLEDAFDR
jgi:hypothetical protein